MSMRIVDKNTIVLSSDPPKNKSRYVRLIRKPKKSALQLSLEKTLRDSIHNAVSSEFFIQRETRKHQEYTDHYRQYLKTGTPMPYVSASRYTKILRPTS